MLEAARWAASSYNSQPWRFVYALRESADWERFLQLLVPFNQTWAKMPLHSSSLSPIPRCVPRAAALWRLCRRCRFPLHGETASLQSVAGRLTPNSLVAYVIGALRVSACALA